MSLNTDETYSTKCAFTEGWIAEHPQVAEQLAVDLVVLWLQGKSRIPMLKTWCEARKLVPIHFYKIMVRPVEFYLEAAGCKMGSLKP